MSAGAYFFMSFVSVCMDAEEDVVEVEDLSVSEQAARLARETAATQSSKRYFMALR
jgi:hypothetical protein